MKSAAAAAALSLATALVAARPFTEPRGSVQPSLPPSRLAVLDGSRSTIWWRSDDAPARWTGPLPLVADAIRWRAIAPGAEWGELRLAGTGEAWRLRVIVARLDPRLVRLRLHANVVAERRLGPWSVAGAPDDALVALNAGQFGDDGPWGWLVHGGREQRPPGVGPLSAALVVDSTAGSERARLVEPDEIDAVRRAGGVVEAVQSYPLLLSGDGVVPAALMHAGLGVDVAHRDARLAIGELRDGRLLIALTRFEGLGGVLEVVPFGLTVPEMAALMGALGCRGAVALDGGISGQLRVREPGGATRAWPGLRRVPLGLVALPPGVLDHPEVK